MSTSTATTTTGVDQRGLYFELSPTLVLVVRIVNVVTLLMVALSVIFCFVQSKDNSSYYLLIVNLGISGLVSLVVNWWYRTGDLGSEKYWFILVISCVILLQCLSADMFVFKVEPSGGATTQPPHTTVTFPWTSNVPASTKKVDFV